MSKNLFIRPRLFLESGGVPGKSNEDLYILEIPPSLTLRADRLSGRPNVLLITVKQN